MPLVLGNAALKSALLSSLNKNEVAGCYLIEGADGSGKRTLARYLAAAFVCGRKNGAGEPCLSCPACKQALSGRHVDVPELEPPADKKNISVDAVRDFLKETTLTPSLGDWHVFLIFRAETMMKGAQNALLKSIEEVRPHNVFFLMTSDASRLLPTVRSRCVKFRMERLSDEVIREELLRRELPRDAIDTAVMLARGSLGKAIGYAGDPDVAARRESVLTYFRAIAAGRGFPALCRIFSPSIRSREEADLLLGLMKLALRDLVLAVEGADAEPEFFTDREFLRQFATVVSPRKAAALFSLAEETIQANLSNVNLFSAVSNFNLQASELTR